MNAPFPSFFDETAALARLRQCAEAWQGTPFRARGKLIQVGVDCVYLCGELMRQAGVVEGYEFPRYSLDRASHRDDSIVLAWLNGSDRFLRLPEGERPRGGDLACFQLGRCVHHCAVLLDERRLVHALQPVGVIGGQLDDPTWAKRLHSVWRPLPL